MSECICEVQSFLCVDCDIDTLAVGEYYMVTDSCWRRAGNVDGMLCIVCLEKRLGKPLTARNFTTCELNWSNALSRSAASKLLFSRMHASRSSRWREELEGELSKLIGPWEAMKQIDGLLKELP
jgi:hypothetical protein